MRHSGLSSAGLSMVAAVAAAALAAGPALGGPACRSPYDVAWSADGQLLAVSDRTTPSAVILDAGGKVLRQVELKGQPSGLTWAAEGHKVYVAEFGAFSVAEVDADAGKVLRRIQTVRYPVSVAVSAPRKLLLVGDYGFMRVLAFDLESGSQKGVMPALSLPVSIAVSPDGSLAAVTNLLPVGDASDASHSASLCLMDLKSLQKIADVKLTSGSALIRDVVFSPDGKWAYAVHTLGRFTLPTTQLDRGWINTNAMTVIDVANKQPYATVLMDRLTEGAADPWGAAISRDGKTLWATLSGTHQLARIDLEKLHLLMDGKDLPKDDVPPPGMAPRHLSAIWAEIKKDPSKRAVLANDLAALYGAGLLIRTKLECNGPRGIALSPDGKKLAVAAYFTGSVLMIDADTDKVAFAVPLGEQPKMDGARRGEMIFHDATYSFQHWLSCATCHPDGASADGLNWDLLNDGIGNPKNTRPLLLSPQTPPMMARGVRPTYDIATTAGFRFILFREPEPGEVDAVKDYIKALQPIPSPYRLPNGDLSGKAKQGKAIFEDAKTSCATCHPAPLLTDLKMYDVGTRGELDRADDFDTPTLLELWRTAPYLHDGSAKTLQEVLTTRNKADKHGKTSHLTKEQIEALVEYLLSL